MSLVSVVIPTYNHRDTVAEAIESALAQEGVDLEIIVVNDGSPDDTPDVLKRYLGRIRYLEQENAGQAAARNRGIAEATGEFVALLDDDDQWPAGKLAWQVEALRKNPDAVLVYGEDVRVDTGGHPLPPTPRKGYKRPSGEVYRDFLEGCWIASPGQTLIRRSAIDQIGGFDTGVWGSDDWDLYLRLAEIGRFIYEDRPALRYRIHGGNASANVLKHLAGHDAAAARHAARGIRWWRRWRNEAKFFRFPLLQLSHAARRNGDLGTSLRAQRAALRFDPTLPFRREWAVPFVLNLLRRPPQALATKDTNKHEQDR